MTANDIKPSFRILVPVWGERYINMFLGIGLPSMLTARNLPALAAEYPCEFVFLTKAADTSRIKRHPTFQALTRICPTSFTPVDDLLVQGMEGYSLTLCFARGMHAVGAKMVDTYFIFMNADFVVSDGTFETLLRLCREGKRAIVAPSLRSCAEDTIPILEQRTDEARQTLTMSSREMVGMTLKHLHPTAAANIVDDNIAFNSAVNQFFWWADSQTLVARFFLLFMFCIRPERHVEDIPGFCDYTFVPEFCPSGNFVVLDDSDQCFLMELQSRDQELHYLRFGQPTFDDVANHLSEWTTANHRLYSKKSIVFHADELPPALENAERNAIEYMNAIFQRMNPIAQGTRDHPYWIGARGAAAKRADPLSYNEEFTENLSGFAKSAILARRLFFAVFGAPPFVNPLHHNWLDYRAALPTLQTHLADSSSKILYVSGGLGLTQAVVKRDGTECQRVSVDDLLTHQSEVRHESNRGFDFCFIYIGTRHLGQLGRILALVSEMTTPEAKILVVLLDDSFDGTGSPFSRILLRQLNQLRPASLFIKSAIASGGKAKLFVHDTITNCATKILRYGVFGSFGSVLGLIFLMPVTWAINLVGWLRPITSIKGQYCSSLTLEIVKK
jgi:hypothetical protein